MQETLRDGARQERAGEFFETENFPAFLLAGRNFLGKRCVCIGDGEQRA